MEYRNRNEGILQEFGMSETELKERLQVYSEMFPHFFEYVVSLDNIRQTYLEVMVQIDENKVNLLAENDLEFLDIIFDKIDMFLMLILKEEDLKRFRLIVKDINDIFEVLSYKYQTDISTWNGIKMVNDDELSLNQKWYEEEYVRTKQLVNDAKFIQVEKDFYEVVMDFGQSEIHAMEAICDNRTKNEKLDVIKQHLGKMKEIHIKRYHLGNRVINLESCKELLVAYYRDIPSMCRFSDDDINSYLNPLSYNSLLIMYNYLRISHNEEALDIFFKSVLEFVRTNLKDSEELIDYKKEISNIYFLEDEIKNLCRVDEYIARIYKNIVAYYHKIDLSIKDKLKKSEIVSGTRIVDTEFRKQQQWLEEEQETSKLYRLLQKEELLGVNQNKINDIKKDIIEVQDQCRMRDIYERMSATMDVLFVFCKGLELYSNSFFVGNKSFLWRVKKRMSSINDALTDVLYLDPYLYEEHIDSINEVKNDRLNLVEEHALEEKKDEEILEKEIEIEEYEKNERKLTAELQLKNIEIQKKEEEIRYIKKSVEEMIYALKESDIDKATQDRRKIIAVEKRIECDIECLDELSILINNIVVEKIQNNYQNSYDRIRQNLVEELGEVNTRRLGDDIISILTTAEFLYEKYIKDKQEIEGFDYSCVSAMYYQALEKTYNNLMYKGYIAKVNQSDDLPELIIRKNKKGKGGYGYFPNDGIGSYVIDYIGKKNNIGYIVKDTCEYGNFIFLLKKVINKNCYKEVLKYIGYLRGQFGWETTDEYNTLPKSVNSKLKYLVAGLKTAKNRRNNASHGGVQINYQTAKEDKIYVLPQKEADIHIQKYRKLIGVILELYNI